MKNLFAYDLIWNKWKQLTVKSKFSIFKVYVLTFIILGLICFVIQYQINTLKDEIIKDKNFSVWVNQANATIKQLRLIPLKSRIASSSSLLTVIDKESKISAWEVYPIEMQQNSSDQVEVSFSQINFDDLISGLEQLWNKHAIQVNTMNVQRIPNTNSVGATFSLQAS